MYTRKELLQFSALGIASGLLFSLFWLASTSLETIPNSVSWFLPAGIRLAFYALSPIKSWPFLYVFDRINYLIMFHPGGLFPSIPTFQLATIAWYMSNLVITPAALMGIVWFFRRNNTSIDLTSISKTLRFLILSLSSTTVMAVVIFGRKALDIEGFAEGLADKIFNVVLGDLIGIFTMFPIVLVLIHWLKEPMGSSENSIRSVVIFWIIYISLDVVFIEMVENAGYYFKVVAILPAIWASYRFGWRGAATTVFFICIMTFLSTWLDGGTTLENQFYIISMSLTCLLLGAASSEGSLLNAQLLEANQRQKTQNLQLRETLDKNRELSTKLIDAQEQERKHLSQELHDDFGQRITDIKLTAAKTKREFADTDNSMERIINKAEQLYSSLKKSIGSLRPAEIDEWGLVTTLSEGEIASLAEQSGVDYTVSVNQALPEMKEAQTIGLYRICQESVTNILKYANAQSIEISFIVTYEDITLKVSDDGHGFDVTKDSSGFGLINIRERAAALGGSVDIMSDRRGTVTTVLIPIGEQ